MNPSNEDINQFKGMYLDEFGIHLTDSEARQEAISLLTFMKAIWEPVPGNEYEKTNEQNKQ